MFLVAVVCDFLVGFLRLAVFSDVARNWAHGDLLTVDFLLAVEFLIVLIASAVAMFFSASVVRSVGFGILYWLVGRFVSSEMINALLMIIDHSSKQSQSWGDVFVSMFGYFVSSILFLPVGVGFVLTGVAVGWVVGKIKGSWGRG